MAGKYLSDSEWQEFTKKMSQGIPNLPKTQGGGAAMSDFLFNTIGDKPIGMEKFSARLQGSDLGLEIQSYLGKFQKQLLKSTKNLEENSEAVKKNSDFMDKLAKGGAIFTAIKKVFSSIANDIGQQRLTKTFATFGRTIESLTSKMQESIGWQDKLNRALPWSPLDKMFDARRTQMNFEREIPQTIDVLKFIEQRNSSTRGYINETSANLVGREIAARPGMTKGMLAFQQAEIQRLTGPQQYIDETERAVAEVRKQMDTSLEAARITRDPSVRKTETVKAEMARTRLLELGSDPNLLLMKKLNEQMKNVAQKEFIAQTYAGYSVATGQVDAFGRATAGVGTPTADPSLQELIRISELLTQISKALQGGVQGIPQIL